jgi:hypothetical protein
MLSAVVVSALTMALAFAVGPAPAQPSQRSGLESSGSDLTAEQLAAAQKKLQSDREKLALDDRKERREQEKLELDRQRLALEKSAQLRAQEERDLERS